MGVLVFRLEDNLEIIIDLGKIVAIWLKGIIDMDLFFI
jgi:hypothetical protein